MLVDQAVGTALHLAPLAVLLTGAVMGLVFDVKLILQFLYEHMLRLFEAVYSPRVVGAFDRKRRVWSNFSHEVIFASDSYETPATEDDIVDIIVRVNMVLLISVITSAATVASMLGPQPRQDVYRTDRDV